VKPSIYLYSATGELKDKKPHQLEKIEALIRRHQARWIREEVSAQLLYLSKEEYAEAESISRISADASDLIAHKGQWRVIQPGPQTGGPSGWQLQHPRINDRPVPMLLEVSA
jgi:hypothetical protein